MTLIATPPEHLEPEFNGEFLPPDRNDRDDNRPVPTEYEEPMYTDRWLSQFPAAHLLGVVAQYLTERDRVASINEGLDETVVTMSPDIHGRTIAYLMRCKAQSNAQPDNFALRGAVRVVREALNPSIVVQ
jgi:hypothetical protein